MTYQLQDNGRYDNDLEPFVESETDSLPVSEIIEYNGRPTYYYERVSNYLIDDDTLENLESHFWIDLQTKAPVKAEYYRNGEMISSSEITLLDTDIEITNEMLTSVDK